MKKRFLANGYPLDIVERYMKPKPMNESKRGHRKEANRKQIYLKVPFINDFQATKIRKEFKSFQHHLFDLKPVFVTQPNLKRSVSFKEKLFCTSNCLCKNNNFCHMKNVVYQLTCNLCESFISVRLFVLFVNVCMSTLQLIRVYFINILLKLMVCYLTFHL